MRLDEENEEAEGKSEAQKYVTTILNGFKLVKGKPALMDLLKDDIDLFGSVLSSYFTMDVRVASGLLFMPADKDLDIQRDDKGKIITLKFSDNSMIGGNSLTRLGAMVMLKMAGNAGFVWENAEPDCYSGLVLPLCETGAGAGERWSRKTESKEGVSLYYLRSMKTAFINSSDLMSVCGCNVVTLPSLKMVLDAMNNLRHVDQSFTFVEPSLDYAIQLLKENPRRATNGYAVALVGAILGNTDVEGRVNTFLEHGATLSLATTLGIPKAYKRPLFDDELKPLDQKLVEELVEEDQVLLSNLTFTSQHYNEVTMRDKVYIHHSTPYGIRNGTKLRVMKDVPTMSGIVYRSLIQGIQGARKAPVVVVAGAQASSDEYADIDI